MSKQNPRPLYLITRYIKECGDNAPKLQKILDDNLRIFFNAKGSTRNHQAWPGGYLQHVADCMSLVTMIFNMSSASIYWPIPCTRASAMLVIFLHDIEKPFMQERMANNPGMLKWSCAQRVSFRDGIITKYKIALTDEERNALTYIHGEGAAYSPNERVMNELAALCHMADIGSARVWYNRNKPKDNES